VLAVATEGQRATITLPTPTAKQRELAAMLAGPAKYILAYGGARSGKTSGLASHLIRHHLTYPGAWSIIIRKTNEDARRTIWDQSIVPLVEPLERIGLCTIGKSPRQIVWANGGRTVTGGAAPGELDKALGGEYDIVWLNECSEVVWQAVDLMRTRLNPRGRKADGTRARPRMLLDCNPPQKTHWTYKAFRLHQDPATGVALREADAYASIKFVPVDNAANLADGFLQTLEGLGARARVRFLDGEWGSTEGQVFPEFDERHIGLTTGPDPMPLEAPKGVKAFRAIDFGYVHPTACLWAYQDHAGRLHIYREYREAQTTSDRSAKAIIEMSVPDLMTKPRVGAVTEELGVLTGMRYRTLSDHQSEYRAQFERAGIRTEAATKNVLESIDAIKAMLTKDQIRISHACPKLLEEIQSYTWEPMRSSDQLKPTPKKEFDDLVDCLRYIVSAVAAPRSAQVYA